jgi:hypothetical protein
MHRIDGAGSTVDNKFTEGDPVGGVQATVVTAPWLNDMQEELMSVLNAAAIAPVKGTQDQLLKSIRSLSVGIIGSARNVKMSVASASVSATLTADQIFLGTSLAGQVYRLASFNKTINLSTTGAGGMDTGTAPVSGFVAIYAIYNPTTATSALLAVNATAARQPEVYGGANMPAGYTASALVSVWPTNASGQFVIGNQRHRRVSRGPVTALNTTTAVATLTTLSIASSVPLNATSCRGSVNVTSSSGSNNSANIASDSSGTGNQYTSQGPGTGLSGNFEIDLSTSQTLFYNMNTTGTTLSIVITISSYEF